MIDVQDLLALVLAYNPAADHEKISAAYEFGALMHREQVRKSGEPYFTHPIAVAAILTELRLDDASIITALLHDVVEDTPATFEDIRTLFGIEIAKLVDGVTKLTKLQLSSAETQQAENFRKLVMAMSEDVRVLLVKLADRLHNMRTIKAMRIEKQQKKARETMDIYAPLAGRMGMQSMREELEDLAFRVINPEARSSIMRRFLSLRKETGDVIPRITQDINALLEEHGIEATVMGREKKPYSIWRKLEEKKESFHRLSDIYGFRIITRSDDDCYKAMGAIHRRWRSVPGRFKDYISTPKSNGYRSIHTTVSGRKARRVEIQIRTHEMHQVAETGVAAHWSYRDGQRFENPFAVDPFHWLRELSEQFEQSDSPAEFLEHVKLEMFNDKVFCFTPKGEVVALPKGATPLDFAYAVHTRVGDSCVGAQVDGHRVPMWQKLRNGQSVTIIRADGQSPQQAWEGMVVTGKAKAAIRRSLKRRHQEGHVRLGRELARIAFERIGKEATPKALATAARILSGGDVEEMLANLGSAELSGAALVGALYPELTGKLPPSTPEYGSGVIGLAPDQHAQQARCCRPLPGERVVGIATEGEGVVIHKIDCDRLAHYNDSTRWIDLIWPGGGAAATHEAILMIVVANDAGVLGRLCTLIGEHNANISDITVLDRKPDFYKMMLELEVRDVEHLVNVQTAIEADSDVSEITRYAMHSDD